MDSLISQSIIWVILSISGTFYAWVFQFVGEMNIIAPGHVKDAYAEYLQEAIDDVLGAEEEENTKEAKK